MNATAVCRAKGYRAKRDVTARNGAHDLHTNPYVASGVAELQRQAAARHAKNFDSLVVDLDRLCDLAIENGQIASRVAAVVGQAKLLGLVLDRAQVEQTVVRVRDPDAPARLTHEEWEDKYAGTR
jgi:phage terminase small subunit